MPVRGSVDRSTLVQASGVVSATVFLTASFVGGLALVSGNAGGIEDRLAVYVFLASVVFATSTITLTRRGFDGDTVLLATIGTSVLGGVLALLAGEGARYAVLRPGEVFKLQVLAYFAAAGLVVIGLSYWTLSYWREFLSPDVEEGLPED